MTIAALPHTLNRTLVIRATPEVVFRFFTDNARWASWWGEGSTIDPRPGGPVLIRYPGGIEVAGEVLEVERPKRIVFTYGFVSGTPIPAGSSRVTIDLTPDADGTRLRLFHELPDAKVRDEHVQGWRYQLSVFANVVAGEVFSGASDATDAWFAAWSIAEPGDREHTLARVAQEEVRFRDRFSTIDGLQELVPHITAAQRFMPAMTIARKGEVRACQGTVLADWIASGPDGTSRGSGTNVFQFGVDGRIVSVTGFWN
jgi:uncharacterized protein YndB with AHSA1/START domain